MHFVLEKFQFVLIAGGIIQFFISKSTSLSNQVVE